jgi:outer membrane protein
MFYHKALSQAREKAVSLKLSDRKVMKKILLLAAMAAGFVSKGQAPQGSDSRVGYANMAYIISQLPDVKAIETDLKSTQTQLRNQIEAKSKQVQQQYTDFNSAMDTMVDTVRMNKQRDLEQAMADLEKMQQDAELTLQNKQKLYMAPVYLKVSRAIEEVAKENGFVIILSDRISNYPFLLYQDQGRDVSNLVLKKFGVTPVTK